MASHRHHHLTAAAAASCYCHCYQPTYTPCHHHIPPPPPDPHLHHLPHLSPPPNLPHYSQHIQANYIQDRALPDPTVSSLLRRIDALESALRRRSSPSQSLRDAAARSIQAHFRAFLVRRSITLRLLKDLASIKSSLGFLKSSVSQKTHFDYDAVYRKAVNLLHKLDAIQGGDPMIRNGKTSLSRELNRFLDFVEGASVKRRIIVKQIGENVRPRVSNNEKKIGNAQSGCLKKVKVDKLRGLMERIDRLAEELDEEQCEEIENPKDEFITRKYGVSSANPSSGGGGVRSKVNKNVSFAEDRNVYRVLRRPYVEDSSDGMDKDDLDEDDDVDDEQELVDDLCRELEEIGVSQKEDVEEEVVDGSSSSDGEKESKLSSTSRGNVGSKHDEDEGGHFMFSAPLPLKMDKR